MKGMGGDGTAGVRGATEGPEIITLKLGPSGGIPNNPRLPVLVYHEAIRDPAAGQVRELMEDNGWTGTWVWRVYDFHHFHPASHEVLVCLRGWAELLIGGPDGQTVRIAPGDALVLPAGTGHCQKAAGDGFEVCGAYPPGQQGPDIVRAGELDEPAAAERILRTPLPHTDPLFGEDGPLIDAWR
jgi:uncharacterized protein YjlB